MDSPKDVIIMKILFTLAFFQLLFASAWGQDTLEVIKYFPNTEQISVHYYVLKSDTSIKHGSFTEYFPMSYAQRKGYHGGLSAAYRFVKSEGRYAYGQKNGYWKEYSRVEVLADEGSYKNDLKVGIWKHYACPDRVIEEHDYTSGQDIPLNLHFGCRYPSIAVELGLSGTIHFSYKLNANCTVSDFKVLKSPHKSFTDELTKYFSSFANIPAQPCQCKERQEVSFMRFSLN